jgi:hypothetical protein
MRVEMDVGKATEEKKKAVLSGALKLRDIGDVKVDVCKRQTDCIPMIYSGPYLSKDAYGIGLEVSGPQLQHVIFAGVKVSVVRPLDKVTISWSNYSQ